MPAYYDEKTKSWYCKFYYTDYTGTKKQKKKRGFKLQREAKEWEQNFLVKLSAQPSLPFKDLTALYLQDKKEHMKQVTFRTKESRIVHWILPYFLDKPTDSITAADVRSWQTDLKNATGQHDKPLSPGYMQNLVTELSSIFNYAVRFYGLTVNPCQIAGNVVGKKNKSLNFWTKEEFDQFISAFDVSEPHYTAFMVLYYTGMRIGELEALTVADVDVAAGKIIINKTFHKIKGEDVTTKPKTEKSIRDIYIPEFLVKCLQAYIKRIYKADSDTRLFSMAHSSYGKKLNSKAATASVKRIRVHDLRHSHASLLIELGFSALLISERLGHESVTTTLNIYAHLFPSKQSEVVDKLQKLYAPEK